MPSLNAFVLRIELGNVNHACVKQLGIAGVDDTNLSRHLTCNDLDMAIVNVNVLTAVYRLDLTDDVVIGCIESEDLGNILRCELTLGDCLTALNVIALGYEHA